MQKIWYGAKNNQVHFAQEPDVLSREGINNPQSFTVNGDVTGLNLTGGTASQQGGGATQGQTHA